MPLRRRDAGRCCTEARPGVGHRRNAFLLLAAVQVQAIGPPTGARGESSVIRVFIPGFAAPLVEQPLCRFAVIRRCGRHCRMPSVGAFAHAQRRVRHRRDLPAGHRVQRAHARGSRGLLVQASRLTRLPDQYPALSRPALTRQNYNRPGRGDLPSHHPSARQNPKISACRRRPQRSSSGFHRHCRLGRRQVERRFESLSDL